MDFGLDRWNTYELTAPDGWEADLDAGGMEDEWMRRCGALGAYGVGDRDDPAMLDRLMDLGLPVLVRRHACNTAQCGRAEQSGLGLAFDDWTQVPGLAERLIGGSH